MWEINLVRKYNYYSIFNEGVLYKPLLNVIASYSQKWVRYIYEIQLKSVKKRVEEII